MLPSPFSASPSLPPRPHSHSFPGDGFAWCFTGKFENSFRLSSLFPAVPREGLFPQRRNLLDSTLPPAQRCSVLVPPSPGSSTSPSLLSPFFWFCFCPKVHVTPVCKYNHRRIWAAVPPPSVAAPSLCRCSAQKSSPPLFVITSSVSRRSSFVGSLATRPPHRNCFWMSRPRPPSLRCLAPWHHCLLPPAGASAWPPGRPCALPSSSWS